MEALKTDSVLEEFDELLSFKDYSKKFLKELFHDMEVLESLEPNDPKIHEYILKIIKEIFSLSCYGDIRLAKPIEFLKKYDSYLTDEEVVKAYFALNNYNIALEYIKFNHERIKRGLKNTYIAFASVDDEGEFGVPSKFEYALEIKYFYNTDIDEAKVYIIPAGYNERSLNYLLYKYFFDDVSFIFLSNQVQNKTDKIYGFCHSLDWNFLKKILLDYYNKKDYKTFKKIANEYVSNSVYLKDLLTVAEPPFDDINFFYEAYKKVMDLEKNFLIIRTEGVTKNLLQYEKTIRESLVSSSSLAESAISNSFYANLKYLKGIDKKERKTTKLFKECFDLFYDFLKDYYNFDITEYGYMFERIFNRIIEGNSFIELLTLVNIESIYHYFKTGEIVNLNKELVTIEDIEAFNTKQYREIRSLIYSPAMALLFYDEHHFSEDAICLLTFFGYDLVKKLIKTKLSRLTLTEIAKHKFKDKEAEDIFREIIINELSGFEKHANEIGKILRVYDYLYENNFKNITLAKIIKRINSFEYVLLPNNINIKDDLEKLDKVSKGEPLYEKLNGITLYNEYHLRVLSSIPDIKGTIGALNYETVDMHAPEIISNGIGAYLHSNGETASSCLTPAGKASSCMNHGATSPHGRFFKVTINGHILAYSWIWRAGNVLCFDNIEVTDEIRKNNISEEEIMELYKTASLDFIKETKANEEKTIEVILIGKNDKDVIQKPFESLRKTKKQIKPNEAKELYLKDSEQGEYILIGDESHIDTTDVEPIYKYTRKPVEKFGSVEKEKLKERINSIYFDYCILTNEKYSEKNCDYKDGYIGEDWFVGYLADGKEEFYYSSNNPDIKNEASKYLNKKVDIKVNIPVIRGDYKELDYFLNHNNYTYDEREVLEYLKSISESLKEISSKDYFHTPRNMHNLGKILYDGAITSSSFGNHSGGNGSNGEHFICVAEMNSSLYNSFKNSDGFIIDENICTFETGFRTNLDFKNSRYPIRSSGGPGERQVLDFIPLTKVKAIRALDKPIRLGMITHLEECTGVDLPIVLGDEHKLVDKSVIKSLIKLK